MIFLNVLIMIVMIMNGSHAKHFDNDCTVQYDTYEDAKCETKNRDITRVRTVHLDFCEKTAGNSSMYYTGCVDNLVEVFFAGDVC